MPVFVVYKVTSEMILHYFLNFFLLHQEDDNMNNQIIHIRTRKHLKSMIFTTEKQKIGHCSLQKQKDKYKNDGI